MSSRRLILFAAAILLYMGSPVDASASGTNECITHHASDSESFQIGWTANTILDLNPNYWEQANIGDGAKQSAITCAANRLRVFLSGPLAQTICTLAIMICGFMWYLNRQSQNAQNLGRIAFGSCLIFLAPEFFGILGFGAGIL